MRPIWCFCYQPQHTKSLLITIISTWIPSLPQNVPLQQTMLSECEKGRQNVFLAAASRAKHRHIDRRLPLYRHCCQVRATLALPHLWSYKMPRDKMPQGHFAPRRFAPNRTKFWKEDILSQLQNFGGHFAPTFFFAYFSGISWLAIAIDLLFYFATKQEKSNVFKPWKTSSRHFCLALFPFPPSAKWWR